MVKKEDLIGKETAEMQALLEGDVAAWAAEVETLETEAELLAREEELVEAMKEGEAKLATTVYALPEGAKFDGTEFSRKVLCEYIVDFLNMQELEWSYSLGMFELVKLWKTRDLAEVSYHAFDSTIRVLGQCKYRGYEAWRKVLAVNEFLKSLHSQYTLDATYMIYLAQLHNTVLDALKKFETPTEEVETEVE